MFTTIFTLISTFFSKNKTSVIIGGLLLLFAGTIYFEFKSNASLKTQLAYANQNILASKDSIRIVQTKDKKEEFDKLSYVATTVKQLQTLNDSLAQAVKNTVGKVDVITNTKIQVVHDTVQLTSTATVADSVVHVTFKYDTVYSAGNFLKFSGYTNYNLKTAISTALLTYDSLGIAFTTGIKNIETGHPEIFIRSQYPGFVATDIQGAILSPSLFGKSKPALITIGLNLSYSPLAYDFVSKGFQFRNQITAGIGLNFNLGRIIGK